MRRRRPRVPELEPDFVRPFAGDVQRLPRPLRARRVVSEPFAVEPNVHAGVAAGGRVEPPRPRKRARSVNGGRQDTRVVTVRHGSALRGVLAIVRRPDLREPERWPGGRPSETVRRIERVREREAPDGQRHRPRPVRGNRECPRLRVEDHAVRVARDFCGEIRRRRRPMHGLRATGREPVLREIRRDRPFRRQRDPVVRPPVPNER